MVIEKEWGSVTGEVHRERVLPWVYRFMDWVAQHPENLTQQLHDLNGLWDRATYGIVRPKGRATKGIVRPRGSCD